MKKKDMQIEVLLKKDGDNSAAIDQLRVKQKKLEGEKFVLKCVLVCLFTHFSLYTFCINKLSKTSYTCERRE